MTEKEAQDVILGLDNRELLQDVFNKILKFYDERKLDYWRIRLIGQSGINKIDSMIHQMDWTSDKDRIL